MNQKDFMIGFGGKDNKYLRFGSGERLDLFLFSTYILHL